MTQWRDRAACRGVDPARWYPEKGQTAKAGRAICAECPVLGQCLAHALDRPETYGVWGGADQRTLRRMRVLRGRDLAWLPPEHDLGVYCDSPSCRWCRTVDAHRASLAEPEGPQQLNGDGARCGFSSTYARGHRDGPCTLAITPQGKRLRDAGIDIAEWWVRWFGTNTDRRLVWHAKRLAEFERPRAEQVAS